MKCKEHEYPEDGLRVEAYWNNEINDCKHKWVGYIVVYCHRCKILKDFFDGFPKK